MTQLKLSRHPVRLTQIVFPEIQLKRQSGLEPPFVFPPFTLTARTQVNVEARRIQVQLLTTSQKATKQKSSGKKPVAAFKLQAAATFSCAEFEQAEKALTEFAASASPYQLMWPYVRSTLVQVMGLAGLPPYHLPLVIAWHLIEDGAEARLETAAAALAAPSE